MNQTKNRWARRATAAEARGVRSRRREEIAAVRRRPREDGKAEFPHARGT